MTVKTVQSSIVGTSFHYGAGDFVQQQRPGTGFVLKREPANKYDKNAIAVQWGNRILGYLPRSLAAELAPLMDNGTAIKARKGALTGCTVTLQYEVPE